METVTKTLLLAYLLISTLAVTMLWQNAADAEASKSAGLLLSALITVLVAVLAYVKTDRLTDTFSYSLLFDQTAGSVICPPDTVYTRRYINMFTNIQPVLNEFTSADPFNEMAGVKGLNIIEYGIINSLQMRFSSGWDFVTKKIRFLGGVQESYGQTPKPEAGTSLSIDDIRSVFKDNPIITSTSTLRQLAMWIPDGAKLSRQSSGKRDRKIIISGWGFETVITIAPTVAGIMQNGVWGILPPDSRGSHDYLSISFQVIVDTKIGWYVFNRNRRTALRNWHQNIAEVLSSYDWAAVENDADKIMTRKATAKTLGMKNQRF